jgi:hypothetical protein
MGLKDFLLRECRYCQAQSTWWLYPYFIRNPNMQQSIHIAVRLTDLCLESDFLLVLSCVNMLIKFLHCQSVLKCVHFSYFTQNCQVVQLLRKSITWEVNKCLECKSVNMNDWHVTFLSHSLTICVHCSWCQDFCRNLHCILDSFLKIVLQMSIVSIVSYPL